MTRAAQVKVEAARLGFVACGITTLEPVPHREAFDRWLASGFAGNMRYLHRQARKRRDPRLVDPDARCAVVVLDNYYYSEPIDSERLTRSQLTPRIARYARGTDYHAVTLRRLELLAAYLRQLGAEVARPYVDTGPIPERELAQRAGLGWIGKSTMLIRPSLGSWVFIGTVLTNLELELDDPAEADHCGSCTRCLEACPTAAFREPRVLDATRCLSYLTIESKGPIPAEIVPSMQGWAFGCDICNEVCPWNHRFAEESRVPEFRPRAMDDLPPGSAFDVMDETTFSARFGDTPLARPGLERMRRNWHAATDSLP
jgi:epoxyqueuosine reductase